MVTVKTFRDTPLSRSDAVIRHSDDAPLRILISAYACEPDRGSEPGIGWQWATRLADCGHEVHVITRANNATVIAHAMVATPRPSLHFHYFDLPRWARFWKHYGPGVQLYYLLWQAGIYKTARRLHRDLNFDVTHHLTFGVFRHASLLAFLDAPFIFGPVGGGESTPQLLRRELRWRTRVKETLRDLANSAARFDPLLRAMYRRTRVVLCKTPETLQAIPEVARTHGKLFLELGVDPSLANIHSLRKSRSHDAPPTILFVGRFVACKGLHLALPAFAQLLEYFPQARFTLIGSGPEEQSLHKLAEQLQISASLDWIAWLPRDDVMRAYANFDLFLFPSLHDSSGNAVIEAMTFGLPVVCLNVGGPGVIVDAESGIRVTAADTSATIEELGRALILLANDAPLRQRFSHGARMRACNHFSWQQQIERLNAIYYALQPTTRQVRVANAPLATANADWSART